MHMEKTRLHGMSVISQFDWPFLVELWQEATSQPRHSWHLPELVAMSFADGCDEEASSRLAAALGMTQLAIKLTDDLLDNEPGGVQARVSAGAVANLSNAFQGCAGVLATSAFPVMGLSRAAAHTLAMLSAETAYGQHLDGSDSFTEEAYWNAVTWKSTPFYKHAFGLGTLLLRQQEMNIEAASVHRLGELFGETVQVLDDLTDIMAEPASGDWMRANNLLVLFASVTDENGRFSALKQRVSVGEELEEAQQYLIDCGAVAYCQHVVKVKYGEAMELMTLLNIGEKRPLRDLFDSHLTAVSY